MIRSVLFFICVFGICNAALSQFKIDKYCQIEAYHKSGFTNAFTMRFVPGNVDSLFSFKDSSVLVGLNKLNGLKSIQDALNLMASQGWKFIAVTTTGSIGPLYFYFRKEFDKADLN